MFKVENGKARVEWSDEIVFTTHDEREIEALEVIAEAASYANYWFEAAEKIEDEHDEELYQGWASENQKLARKMCEVFNLLTGSNVKWYMF